MAFQIKYTEPDAQKGLLDSLLNTLSKFPSHEEIVCVCIGTDRSTGDSLGPLVGSLLAKEKKPKKLVVLGTLDKPVHALNLGKTLTQIKQDHPHALIIAIDACLGQLKQVGSIQLGTGPLQPGAGVNKKLPSVGQFHITGIVNVAGFMEYLVLQNTRLSIVMNMAEIISSALLEAVTQLQTPSAAYQELIFINEELQKKSLEEEAL